ncbi:acetate--CoA ligase family protein [uncultured Roseobacter sp.]|uniref:acetate--CoA ligase family protein n=1 Tax=uncultured Roseobacter sp. TaxID=114847 RepID=UPI0026279862|nr:acetate--CoA ligase family protein [uncultured Roseobacter sp.]
MARDLSRLLRPVSVVVIGGGAWCRQVVRQLQRMGFSGDIWRVHPDPAPVEGIAAFADLDALPGVPDAAFVGVNRHLTVESVAALSRMGAGGAVCFASGFSEAVAEDAGAGDLQGQLVAAAGDMPLLGPNCYGFVNALDGVLLWPDQHGCQLCDRGVAILTQSSNIAINLTMQKRALPLGMIVTCGNMAQTSQADIALALLEDPRITAIGLHVEGFGNTEAWHTVALRAQEKGVPLVALKAGASEQARAATVSHTASLAGSDAGAAALLERLGIPRVRDLPTFLETLKVLHCAGPLRSSSLSSISCSGGEASLMGDTAEGRAVSFPALQPDQKAALSEALGPMVALSNPLDYHTYIWGDADRMARAWLPMAAGHIGLLMIIVDYPHTDATDWCSATEAALMVQKAGHCPVAVVATLPELMPEDVAAELMAGGVIAMSGLTEAVHAAEAASACGAPQDRPPLQPGAARDSAVLTEPEAKSLLAGYGMQVPRGVRCDAGENPAVVAGGLTAPLVLKSTGVAHKSDTGGVVLGLAHADLACAASEMPDGSLLIEEMVQGGVAELLVGVTRDEAHGFLLTLAAGGVLTELWQDRTSLLLPVSSAQINGALQKLRCWPLLTGYRGKAAADVDAIIAAVLSLQDCVIALADRISEVEINPMICTPDAAVAADALMSLAPETE